LETFGTLRYDKARETRIEKIERIRKELLELEEHGRDHDMVTDANVLRRQVDQLQQQFHGVVKRQFFTDSSSNFHSFTTSQEKDSENSSLRETTVPVQDGRSVHTSGNSLQQQEERLLRLEKMIGTQIQTKSMMERLRIAEHKLSQIDEKTLAQAAARAKVIRADLEAAAKAKSKLNSSSSSSDSAKISKLYNQLVAFDGFLSPDSQVLHAIVNRLEACADLHKNSMDFDRGLDSLETTVGDVKTLLSSLEESVSILEKGMKENMKIIQENMETLDKRFT
jgi:exonuclease VII small subunit